MKVHPTAFALLQRCAAFAPWAFSAALIAWVPWFIQGASRSWLGTALLFLAAGGGVIGHAVWAMENDWHGLIRTPRHSWRVTMRYASIVVETHWLDTIVPLDRVVSAEIVTDGSWEQLRGVENHGLVLRLAGATIISIPGSSTGFEEVVTGLSKVVRVHSRELN